MNITLSMLLYTAKQNESFVSSAQNETSTSVRGVRILGQAGSENSLEPDYLYVRKKKAGAELLFDGLKLQFEDELDFAEVFNHLHDAFIALRDWDMRLHEGIIEDKGLQYMLDISEEILRHPMTVTSPGFKLIAHTKQFTDGDFIFTDAIKKGYLSESAVKLLDDVGSLYEKPDIRFHKAVPGRIFPILTGSIFFRSDYRYMLTLLLPNKENPDGIFGLFQALLAHITTYVERNEAVNRIQRYAWDALLSDLIENKCNRESFDERNNYSHLPTDGPFRLLLIQRQKEVSLHDYLAKKIETLLPDQIVFQNDQNIFVLLREEHGEDHGAVSTVSHAIDRVRPLLKENKLILGISESFESLLRLHIAFRNAETAIRLGMRVCQNRTLEAFDVTSPTYETTIFKYSDYYPHDLMSLGGRSAEELFSMLPVIFTKLLSGAEKHDRSDLRLLYTYLQNDCNKTKTASELFMHRNNVIYRLARIEEKYDLDFADEKTKRLFRVSFLALELIPPESL